MELFLGIKAPHFALTGCMVLYTAEVSVHLLVYCSKAEVLDLGTFALYFQTKKYFILLGTKWHCYLHL